MNDRDSENKLKVIVIGGGAAGFFAAIAAAKTSPNIEVTLLEASGNVLSKVRISGGGRCNVTHACFDPALLVKNYPRGHKELRGCLTKFQPGDTVDWFEKRGVKLKTEADGRMFPVTDDSETIVHCLHSAAIASEVDIRTRSPVVAVRRNIADRSPLTPLNKGGINPSLHFSETQRIVEDSPLSYTRQSQRNDGNGFTLQLKSGEQLHCDRLLLATGSSRAGYQLAQNLGHTIVPPVPSLFTFNIADDRLHQLAGIAVENATVKLPECKLSQTGPVLITHWGFSGPAVLKLSAYGARELHDCRYQTPMTIDWLSDRNLEEIKQQLQQTKSDRPRQAISTVSPFPLPKRLWQYLVQQAAIDPQKRWTELAKKESNRLSDRLKRSQYDIVGKGIFKEEFVTCGGIKLKEIDFKTMESRICPHLYFAGEILDIDGITGGFNFQNAWTTGWIAGNAIA